MLVIGRGIVALPPETYNILGTMKTENLGIEKVLVNLVSNPRIRFLVVCGPEEFGHFPGDAITKLAANGVDERKRIVGPRSAIPYLCNIPREVVERFRGQVEVVDLVHPKEAEEIIFPNPEYTFDQARTTELLAALEDCRKRDPGRYPEPPIIALSRALTMDAGAAVHSIDRMAIDFTSQMLRLPSERLSTEASLVELSHTFGLFLDPVDGVVQEAPSVEFAEKLRRYYRGGS